MLVAVISWAYSITLYQVIKSPFRMDPKDSKLQTFTTNQPLTSKTIHIQWVYEPFHLKHSQFWGGCWLSSHLILKYKILIHEGRTYKKHRVYHFMSSFIPPPKTYMTTTSHPRCHTPAILSDRPMHQPYHVVPSPRYLHWCQYPKGCWNIRSYWSFLIQGIQQSFHKTSGLTGKPAETSKLLGEDSMEDG